MKLMPKLCGTNSETLYASKTSNNKLFFLKRAMHLMYKEGNCVFDHLNEILGCFDQLFGMTVKFDDYIFLLCWLNTLLDSRKTFRVSLTNATPNGNVPIE